MDVSGLPGVLAGGDQVPDGAVDEELLLADHDRNGGSPGDGRLCHDRSMPRQRHGCRINAKEEGGP